MPRRKANDTGSLGNFEGRPITEVRVILRKTGDGLSEAVKVEPLKLNIGDEGYIALAYKVVAIDHPAEKRDEPTSGGVLRVQILDAGTMTFLDDDVVARAIEDQELRIARWREEQEGVSRLKGTDLAGDHVLGEHASGRVEGCPKCDEEADLEASET